MSSSCWLGSARSSYLISRRAGATLIVRFPRLSPAQSDAASAPAFTRKEASAHRARRLCRLDALLANAESQARSADADDATGSHSGTQSGPIPSFVPRRGAGAVERGGLESR